MGGERPRRVAFASPSHVSKVHLTRDRARTLCGRAIRGAVYVDDVVGRDCVNCARLGAPTATCADCGQPIDHHEQDVHSRVVAAGDELVTEYLHGNCRWPFSPGARLLAAKESAAERVRRERQAGRDTVARWFECEGAA